MEKNFNGIAIYQIENDGCLNGLYINQGLNVAKTNNEIARKVKYSDDRCIVGNYNCVYMEENSQHQCLLEIQEIHGKQNVYDVFWKSKENNLIFQGIGYIIRKDLFVVNYWPV